MSFHRVLVLAYYFPPMGLSGVQRTSKFVKYLPEYGWHPTVIASGPTAYYAHDESLLKDFEDRPIEIHRTSGSDPNSLLKSQGTMKMPRESIRKMLSRISNTFFVPDNKKSWAKNAFDLASELIEQNHYDALFVSGPPFSSMMAGARLNQKFGIPLTVDYRDLWFGNQFHFYPTPWHAHQHKKLEHYVLRHASAITVTNRRLKERLIGNYPHVNFEDVNIIPHGYDTDDYPTDSSQTKNSEFTLTYAGIFYDFVTPKYFFKAVKKLLTDFPNVKIRLNFAGILREENLKYARKLGIADIISDLGYLPHTETVELLMKSDALWMMVGNTRNSDTVSSGKLYEYFGSNKPLLVTVPEGSLKSDAERYGAAWITDPTNVEAIATCLKEMYDAWQNGALPKPNQKFVAQHDRQFLTAELARTLASTLRVV
ncbi:MAG: glycosyltransferase [Ignavibacteria bacterium]|nr:glycosyltransferase [Ignavibacteria bacterium]